MFNEYIKLLSGQVGLSNVSTAVTRIIRYVEREFKAEARTSWSI